MTNLNERELMIVAGGVTAGPNGETCTEPRKDTQDKLDTGPDVGDLGIDFDLLP